MALRITLSLDEDVATEVQKAADRSGRSLEETIIDSLRVSLRPRLVGERTRPFVIRAKALHVRPGFNLDNIGELLEQAEGPAHR